MTNVFKESAAPYVLVLLLSLAGWMFNSAIENASKLRVVEYRVEDGTTGGVATKTIFLRNRSMSGAVNAGNFLITCVLPGGGKPCLAKLPTVGTEAQFLQSGNVILASNPSVIPDDKVAVPALIPPRGAVAYRIGVSDVKASLRLVYNVEFDPVLNKQADAEIMLVEDRKFDWSNWNDASDHILAFVLGNYIPLLFSGIVVLTGSIAIWLVIQLLSSIFTSSKKETENKTVLKVTVGGITHDVTVEEV
ncbi:hypothetical protein [Sinorhizobium chiapasense]|uniref:Uncharacterized protein n=1 Tax=Sinorhizobium chiapasense TaxID=501572 RepID=A0ABZ2BMT9_9HYPH